MRKLFNILYNFHWVVPGETARAAQPYLGLYDAFLGGNGIKALINLRGRHPKFGWWKDETEACARQGIAHLDVMLDSRRLPLKEMLVALIDAFDAAPRPFVVKCSGGQDRSSFASALYIVHRFGWEAMERAQEQFAALPYLHFPKEDQRWLRAFLAFARERANGKTLAEWIRQDYEPKTLAEHLKPGSFNGIWEPWKPPSSR